MLYSIHIAIVIFIINVRAEAQLIPIPYIFQLVTTPTYFQLQKPLRTIRYFFMMLMFVLYFVYKKMNGSTLDHMVGSLY